MYLFYSLLLVLAFVILLPRFIFDAFHHGKYVAGFRERLGSVSPLESDGRPVVWIHCASVGETQAARPLVRGLRDSFPEYAIAISTITLTGQKLARQVFKNDATKIFYFPFDWRWIVRKTLKATNPSTVLIMETELWPGFLRECKLQGIPVALVNGRLSENSFRRYRVIKGFIARVLSSINLAVMQTEADADRLEGLGMDSGKVFVAGNMKFDAGADATFDTLTKEVQERFRLTGESPLILAASTHAPEESIVLNAFKEVKANSDSAPRLIIAPRHPERFREVASLIESSGLTWGRRTGPNVNDAGCEVILLDSIGELQSVYALASIVFVGGSIAKAGGHNILEPAAVGACVITGAYTQNFHQIVEMFVQAEAVIRLQPLSEGPASQELARVISELLADPAKRDELGKRAKALVIQNRGATDRTLELLTLIIPSAGTETAFAHLSAHGAPSA